MFLPLYHCTSVKTLEQIEENSSFLQSGKLDFVQSLMEFGPKLLVKDKLGNTPVHYAAEKHPEVLDTMLKKAQDLGKVLY